MARNTNGTGFSLKDELFNAKKVAYLSTLLVAADKNFDVAGFETAVNSKLKTLELKERIVWIAECLEEYLPDEYVQAMQHIVAALPEPLDPTNTDDDFGDFIFAPFGEFIVRNGLSRAHLKLSLNTLAEVTKRFSMEFYIRPFIDTFPTETLAALERWSQDDNYHVRRLVSEGTRARLPWAGNISIDPLLPLTYLDTLHADNTRYVTRSVANHLNDIAKIDPQAVIAILKKWQREQRQTEAELAWITKHALRTLVKDGNADALALLGYTADPLICVSVITLKQSVVSVGEAVQFSFTVEAEADVELLIDYSIDFMKANGKRKAKVHKLKLCSLKAGESVLITKKHPFRAGATTITFYPGVHTITLQINGEKYSSVDFELLA